MGYGILGGFGREARYDDSLVPLYCPGEYDYDLMIGGQESYGELYLREHRADLMDEWMAGSKILEVVPSVESFGVMVPVKGREHNANIAGVKFDSSYMNINMRDTGKYLTLEHEFRFRLMDFMQTEDGYDLAVHLNKLGYDGGNVDFIGVGLVGDNSIFEVVKLVDGNVGIIANKNYLRMIENEAKSYDMKPEELMEVAIAEEFTHLFRGLNPRLSNVREEKVTKTILKEFYESLESRTADSSLKEKYVHILKHLKHDIATVGRYAKVYSSDRGKLETILEAEAISERGLEGDSVSEYVSARLEAIAAEVDGECDDLESGVFDSYDGDVACEVECASDGEVVCAEASVEGGESGGGDADSGGE